MRRMRWAIAAITCGVWLAIPTGALATKYIIINPPGSAGPNEYSEVIPSSAGNVAPPSSGGATGTAARKDISGIGGGGAGVKALSRLGSTGKAAAAFAAATAPARPTPAQPRGTTTSGLGSNTGSVSPGGSVSAGLADALTGSDAGGLGLLLPLLLATAVVAALGIGATRLRGRGRPPELGA